MKDKERYNPREYEYVGPEEIYKRIKDAFKGTVVKSSDDILSWIIWSTEKSKKEEIIICTFIINLKGELVLADRHSEHVLCANGENVKTAGEIGFELDKGKVIVDFITNQSTGYCPSSVSWSEVEQTLSSIKDLSFPNGFEPEFVFSYCPSCETRQIVKDEFYFCPRCEGPLLSENEFQSRRRKLKFK